MWNLQLINIKRSDFKVDWAKLTCVVAIVSAFANSSFHYMNSNVVFQIQWRSSPNKRKRGQLCLRFNFSVFFFHFDEFHTHTHYDKVYRSIFGVVNYLKRFSWKKNAERLLKINRKSLFSWKIVKIEPYAM